jgi:hypothetical protein
LEKLGVYLALALRRSMLLRMRVLLLLLLAVVWGLFWLIFLAIIEGKI